MRFIRRVCWRFVHCRPVFLCGLLIALCFAELGSIFDRSGGPYLYAQAAFGSFVGFEVGAELVEICVEI